MAPIRLTMSRFHSLKDTYKSVLNRHLEIANSELEKEKDEIADKFVLDIKLKVIETMKNYGYPVVVNVYTKTNWKWNQPKETVINITFNDAPKIPELDKFEKKRIANCEKFQKKFRELDEWELKCIKDGEITDFKLPDVPKPQYKCD